MAQLMFDTFLENPLFCVYAFYSSVLVLKMMFVGEFTGFKRLKHKVVANPEDAAMLNVTVRVDERVERVRRAHLNDLENIPIFFVVSFIYVLTNPAVFLATNLFRAYTLARFIYTFVYAVVVMPQPARGAAFLVGLIITGYMAVQNVLYFL